MSILTFREGTGDDLRAIEARTPGERIELANEYWATFLVDDEPAAMWGILMHHNGVGDLAGLVTDKVRGRHALPFMRWSRRLLKEAAYDLRLRRLAAYVHAEKTEYRRFAEAFGFHPESVMAQAGPTGGDVIVYVRMYPWATSLAVVDGNASRSVAPRPRSQHLHLRTMQACGRTIAAGPEKPASGTRATSSA